MLSHRRRNLEVGLLWRTTVVLGNGRRRRSVDICLIFGEHESRKFMNLGGRDEKKGKEEIAFTLNAGRRSE